MSIEIKNRSSTKNQYYLEIDGLRAFAIVAVIVNHFNKDILPGGYLGVDIFFIISGFVMTSSLYQRPTENFRDFISGFYERRIKRLFPALLFFVLITSISICFFNPEPIVSLRTGLASLFGLSNLYLFKQSTDYFSQSTELNVFTHTWSLGVEKQFYILFPFLIWFSGFGRQTKNGARNLFLILGVLTIISLTGFLYLYKSNQTEAYFLMPTRFWEMASGCLLFIGFHKIKSIKKLLEKIPPLLVLLLIIGVMYLPMSLAKTSTISVVVLSAVLITSLKKQTYAFEIFTHPKVVYVGLISYSLYLWHWGILSISRWTIGIHWWSIPFQISLIFGLAITSYQYIETPLRKSNWFSKGKKILVVGGGILVTLSGVLITLEKPLKGVLYLGNHQSLNHPMSNDLSRKKCPPGQEFEINLISNCILSSSNGRQILSIGDSQTGHLRPLLNKLHKNDGYGVYFYSSNDVNFPSLVETTNYGEKDPDSFREKYKNSTNFFKYYFSQLNKGDIIILSSRYELRWGNRPINKELRNLKFTYYDSNNKVLSKEQSYNQWKTLFDNIAEKSLKKGINVIVFNSIPTFSTYVPIPDKQWFNSLNKKNFIGFKRNFYINHSKLVDSAFDSLENKYSNVAVFDIFSELCPESQIFCTNEKYRDNWHLSTEGALSLYEGLLKELN